MLFRSQYVLMASEYLPDDFEIGQMRAEYKTAALLDDAVIPVIYEEEGVYVISLNAESGKQFAVVEFRRKD